MKLADILTEAARNEKKNGLVVDASGTKRWYKNGKLHRTDGPAIEWANGTKHWFLNNKFHRTDGPAIEWANGTHTWYVNDKLYTSNKSFQQAAKLSDKEMIALVLKYGDVS